jgi:hypothetical protein
VAHDLFGEPAATSPDHALSNTCECPFVSEVRVRGCRDVSRTSEAGH